MIRIAARMPAGASIRGDADFLWMLGAAHFLRREYAAAEAPLQRLFDTAAASDSRKAAAAYGLCGVHLKTGNVTARIHYALWLKEKSPNGAWEYSDGGRLEDQSIYLAYSGWDFASLVDFEAPVEALREYVESHPETPGVRRVKYALAVRLARAEQYDASAAMYEDAGSIKRAERMRQLAEIDRDRTLEGRYRKAKFLSEHSERVYFNDTLWNGFQDQAMGAERDSRLTRKERERLMRLEREVRDLQEERWRAYRLLDGVVRKAGRTDLGRRAARLGLACLRGINVSRFGRAEEIQSADVRLHLWLRR